MDHKKNSMLKSSIGSVFTIFSEQELEEWNEKSGNYVAVSGAVKDPRILEIKEHTTLREIIDSEGLKNVVNDQYKENYPSDTTKGTHIDLAKSITFDTASPTQTQAISTISPYFSYIKKASNTQEYSDMKKSIDNSLFTFTFTLNSVEEKTA